MCLIPEGRLILARRNAPGIPHPRGQSHVGAT